MIAPSTRSRVHILRHQLCAEGTVASTAPRDPSQSASKHEVTEFAQQQPVAREQEVENWQDLQEKQGTTVTGVISSLQYIWKRKKKKIKE